MKRSIRSRIEYALIAAALIPLCILALYVYFTTQKTLTNAGLENNLRQVTLLGSDIEHTLTHVPGDLFYLRDANSMHHLGRALVINDSKAIEEYSRSIARDFLSIAKNRRIYNQIRFIAASGQELIRIEHDEAAGSSRVLQAELLQDKRQSPHFISTAKLGFGDVYISAVDLNREHNALETPLRPTIRFATPVFAVGERLIGVLILNVDANAFLSKVRSSNADGATQFILANPQGYLLENPNNTLNWGASHELNHGANLSSVLPSAANQITALTQLAHFKGDGNLISALPVYATPKRDVMLGHLISVTPKSVVLALLDDFLIAFGLFFAIAILCAVLAARKLAHSLTAPLLYLTKAAVKLSKGDIKAEIKADSGDEIEALAEAFERLRESIKLLMKLG